MYGIDTLGIDTATEFADLIYEQDQKAKYIKECELLRERRVKKPFFENNGRFILPAHEQQLKDMQLSNADTLYACSPGVMSSEMVKKLVIVLDTYVHLKIILFYDEEQITNINTTLYKVPDDCFKCYTEMIMS